MMAIKDKLPEKIQRLSELAYNLWWSWTPEARELFRLLDYPLWRKTSHNPVEMLIEMSTEQLEARAKDAAWLLLYDRVMILFDKMLTNGHTRFHTTYPELTEEIVAYFSFEFGLHNSLPIYSGGLGIYPAITPKKRATWDCRLLASASCIRRGIFVSAYPPMAGRKPFTNCWTLIARRSRSSRTKMGKI